MTRQLLGAHAEDQQRGWLETKCPNGALCSCHVTEIAFPSSVDPKKAEAFSKSAKRRRCGAVGGRGNGKAKKENGYTSPKEGEFGYGGYISNEDNWTEEETARKRRGFPEKCRRR